MELATRRVHFAGSTTNPDESWLLQVARNVTDAEDGFLRGKKYLLMDRDAKFSEAYIETESSVDRLPEILKVEGLDLVFIRPTDLSNSLGHPGEIQHPRVQATLQRCVEMVQGAGPVLGIMVPNVDAARLWKSRGARYITVGLEGMLNPACRNYLQSVREA